MRSYAFQVPHNFATVFMFAIRFVDDSGFSRGPFSFQQLESWLIMGHFNASRLVAHAPHGTLPPSDKYQSLGNLVQIPVDRDQLTALRPSAIQPQPRVQQPSKPQQPESTLLLSSVTSVRQQKKIRAVGRWLLLNCIEDFCRDRQLRLSAQHTTPFQLGRLLESPALAARILEKLSSDQITALKVMDYSVAPPRVDGDRCVHMLRNLPADMTQSKQQAAQGKISKWFLHDVNIYNARISEQRFNSEQHICKVFSKIMPQCFRDQTVSDLDLNAALISDTTKDRLLGGLSECKQRKLVI